MPLYRVKFHRMNFDFKPALEQTADVLFEADLDLTVDKSGYSAGGEAWGLVQDDCEKENLPPYYSTELVGLELIEQLQEFKDLGWYELITVLKEDVV